MHLLYEVTPAIDSAAAVGGELLPRSGIVVSGITKTYKGGKIKALNNLSLEIRPGEALGLVGPNGAGKTTLLSCLMGFLLIDSGSILIDGEAPDALATRRVLGYLPERLTFDRWMTGRDYMQYHHELAGMPEATRKLDCEALLEKVELHPSTWSVAVKKYSRGMLQRLGFAQALVGKPRYLLLDEPASGMDPHGVMIVRQLLKTLKEEGLTILLNSHQLDQIEKVCDRVIFIKAGTVSRVEDLNEKIEQEEHLLIRWLSSATELRGEDFGRVAQKECLAITEVNSDYARVSTAGSAATVKLIKALVTANFPISEVRPEDTRLERLFIKSSQEEPTA
jgi:ABC-2 type transport system ATP-binding protein